MKKAREVIADKLYGFLGIERRFDEPDAAAVWWADLIVKTLSEKGFVIVPKEPTEGMIEAAQEAYNHENGFCIDFAFGSKQEEFEYYQRGKLSQAYSAMLLTAQKEG